MNGFFLSIIFFDKINRMNWIFLRFPDETAEITSACRRKFGVRLLANSEYKNFHQSGHHSLREADCIFPVSSGNRESKVSK